MVKLMSEIPSPGGEDIEASRTPEIGEVLTDQDDVAILQFLKDKAIDLTEVLQLSQSGSVYTLAFDSLMKLNADHPGINALDKLILGNVANAKGFIAYIPGQPDETGNCMSVCLWESREDALVATFKDPNHKLAVEMARDEQSGPYAMFRPIRRLATLAEDGITVRLSEIAA